jgi:hypothetical protein
LRIRPPTLSEQFVHDFLAVIEDRLELAADQERVRDAAERAERKCVLDAIADLRATSDRAEGVLVVPRAIRTRALFVDELSRADPIP